MMKASWLVLVLLAVACAEFKSDEPPAELRNQRAIWVTRWDYLTREDVERVVEEVAEAGFDTLLFQVRGNATTFYPSKLEPWAVELGGADPGFDPLAIAIDCAHARGLALHAWVNVTPAWWGNDPPEDPAHVINAHPEWLWYDQEGERQAYSERFYVSLNPCLPEVRAHLDAVFRDLLARYELDGLHLDYVRFPNEKPAVREGQDFPRDARTLELFAARTGFTPEENGEAWDQWRADCVTRIVRELRVAARELRPDLVLSAAVGAEAESAWHHHQDWPRWIEEGLLDAVYPMNYTADPERFARRIAAWREWSERVPVVMGLMVGALDDAELLRRTDLARRDFAGACWFGYPKLWDSANTEIEEQSAKRSAERAARREALLPLAARN